MRLAFVPPRFGPDVLGGSESLMREAAFGLAGRGYDVQVLTTTAVDHYTWENELPEGASGENGIVVRRFPVVRHPSRVALRAQLSIGEGVVPSLDQQVSWLGFQFACPGLFEHLLRSGQDYDAIVFSPYLFWSTTVCVPYHAARAVVIPCLHDETYARLDIVRPVLSMPALVWFLSAPEHHLAHTLGPVSVRHSVVGGGVPVPSTYDAAGFRARHGLGRPFVIFAGRREAGKGGFEDACAAAESVGADVVSIGKGAIPDEFAGKVVDLGFLCDRERDNALAAATALVQPSRNESFSRTIMESWLAGTPVLALSGSPVVEWHCERSGGGLVYGTGTELKAALRLLLSDRGRAGEMAAAGRRYVTENYTWPSVLDRMEASLQAVFPVPAH